MIQMMFYSYFGYFALASSNIMRISEEIILDEMYGILERQKIMAELNLFKIEPNFVPIDKENEFYDITNDVKDCAINLIK